MDRVCAVVVTYFPPHSVVKNVKLLAEQADEVVVVDNGTAGASAEYLKQLQDIPKVTLIRNGQNLGIAAALNIGARYAIEHGYPWLATFDQDSRVPPDYLRNIFAGRDSIQLDAHLAILSPIFYDESINQIWSLGKGGVSKGSYIEIDAAISSGSVMSTQLFAEAGFFDESLFIDYVDFDFCLRCRQKGYKIIQLNSVVLNHNLGRNTSHKILGIGISTTNHSSIRRYYITRNRLVVYGRYSNLFPHWVLMNIVGFFKESVKVLAFEEQKFAKFWMMFLGMWHALINKRGSLQVQVFQNNLGQQAYIQNKPVNLPNFFIVGAAKAGTSSIGEYLSRHPEIYISPIKEPHFFSEDIRMADFRPDYRERATLDVPAYLLNHPLPNKHIAYIEDQSQYLELFREVEKEQAIGELSTGYLYSNSAAENLFKFKPDAKIVMVLRQPVERAYSHYLMNLRDLWDHDSGFINALERDFTASEKGWGRSHLYVELGLYFEQVSRYLKCFPGNQVKIVLYEDFKNDPVGFIKELCEFLGVSSSALIAKDMEERKNIATLPRFKILNMYLPILNKCRRYFGMFLPDKAKDQIRSAMFSTKNIPKLQGDEFEQAMKYFSEDIQKLSVLIKRDLQNWQQMSNGLGKR
jgi:GT2 family glycosyltransferase